MFTKIELAVRFGFQCKSYWQALNPYCLVQNPLWHALLPADQIISISSFWSVKTHVKQQLRLYI